MSKEAKWISDVKMDYCKCLLCQMALSTFQLPPHLPIITIENPHFTPKPQENK